MDDNRQYLQMFLDESAENIQRLSDLCLQLERGETSDTAFAELFRAAHTLKGMSATMGFHEMAHLTHALEDALGFLRDHSSLVDSDVVDLLLEAVAGLEQNLSSIINSGIEPAASTAVIGALRKIAEAATTGDNTVEIGALSAQGRAGARLLQSTDIGTDVAELLTTMQAQGIQVVQVDAALTEGCMMKGPRAIMVMNAIDQFGDCLYSKPEATELENGNFDGTMSLLVALRDGNSEQLKDAAGNISEVASVDVQVWSAETVDTKPAMQMPSSTASAVKSVESPRVHVEQTIRVPVERLDRLMNLLSELVIDKTRLTSLAGTIEDADLRALSEHMSRVSSELQSSVMALRMVPVDTLFQRFPRMIRDLSKSLGKEIALELVGGETELDRTVIDEMGEALVHLLRNAADHGLEQTSARTAAGKESTGHLRLYAYASGQHVMIEVSDDGSGIDVERVRAKAVERGLATEAVAAQWSNEQVYQMLFASGFSTAEQVSDISGRGVGMDAVKSKVERLGGTVFVRSEQGKGTTVTVQLPLTLSILQALLVRVGESQYAIPLGGIEEVLAVDKSEIETVQSEPFLRYRNRLVPIVDAGRWLDSKPVLAEMPWLVVICKDGARNIAIAIDDLERQQEIVHKPLGAYLEDVELFSGATILGDGTIALILDVHRWTVAVTEGGAQVFAG